MQVRVLEIAHIDYKSHEYLGELYQVSTNQ